MLFPRAQRLESSQDGEQSIFHVLDAHLPQECGVVIKAASRHVVVFEVNKKEDDSDLDEVKGGFWVDPWRILVLVQE